MKSLVVLGAVALAWASSLQAVAQSNVLPNEVSRAITTYNGYSLYFILPANFMQTKQRPLCGFPVHSHTALDDTQAKACGELIEKAVANWDGHSGDNFNPRHGIVIFTGNHTFQILISYDSERLRFYRDYKQMGEVGFTGSSEPLDQLMRTNGLFFTKEQATTLHFRQGNDE